MTVGLYLSPGASRAAYQAGALQVLIHEGGLRFDVIGATSVGAVNGAFAATGQIDAMVDIWSGWRTRDVLRVNWMGMARKALWWAPSLMDNRPEKAVVTRHIDDTRLMPGVRFRINLANLDTGEEEPFEWPGAAIPLADGVCASVAVPAVAPPVGIAGSQWADGFAIDGFAIESLVLSTGVSRAYAIGIAPRALWSGKARGRYQLLNRAIEWNQYTETWLALAAVSSVNERVQAWEAVRREAAALVGDAAGGAQRLDRLFADAGFPLTRPPVEIIAILPSQETHMSFSRFSPGHARALIEQGRQDARAVLARVPEAA